MTSIRSVMSCCCRSISIFLGDPVQSPCHDMAEEMISASNHPRRMPDFLANAAPDAEVHSGFLDMLDSFQQDQGGREPLAETVKELTGKWPFLMPSFHMLHWLVLQTTAPCCNHISDSSPKGRCMNSLSLGDRFEPTALLQCHLEFE